MPRPLNPDGRRIRTIIISAPFLVASSLLLYKRLYLGEEQRHLPPRPPHMATAVPAQQQRELKGDLEGVPADIARRIRDAEDESRR
ncbi:uncharacterized protein RHOBADRAFT_66697 [Rhodotorula graminis WP1]|uniref:Uncharacterized protein n=1 Tax=Rhodotorula graminis (strain WP1) TaxID=578459 RepID=A0A0P9EP66_RHOGW|nr:uncharacterized protein RHOBADRAFT_66697 [Rhodotorula graminis WP1]KPV74009.1 hypothetical protein RHOBADRAFT_66697 [Rhodotorula graminis WP1]